MLARARETFARHLAKSPAPDGAACAGRRLTESLGAGQLGIRSDLMFWPSGRVRMGEQSYESSDRARLEVHPCKSTGQLGYLPGFRTLVYVTGYCSAELGPGAQGLRTCREAAAPEPPAPAPPSSSPLRGPSCASRANRPSRQADLPAWAASLALSLDS